MSEIAAYRRLTRMWFDYRRTGDMALAAKATQLTDLAVLRPAEFVKAMEAVCGATQEA